MSEPTTTTVVVTLRWRQKRRVGAGSDAVRDVRQHAAVARAAESGQASQRRNIGLRGCSRFSANQATARTTSAIDACAGELALSVPGGPDG
jgi:hypothetical protein